MAACDELCRQLYEFSADMPAYERYNLTAQLRRAAVSVPLNIAEGAGCASPAEFARFLGYAYRSLKEVDTCLELCRRIYHTLPTTLVIAGLIEEADQIASHDACSGCACRKSIVSMSAIENRTEDWELKTED